MIFSHGTRCAGVLAGKHHGECRNEGGIAYNAQLAGKKSKIKHYVRKYQLRWDNGL